MSSTGRPGEDDYFSEYYDKEPTIQGSVNEISYKIYKIRETHYSAYAQFNGICACMIETGVLPRPPVREDINFGPTKDNWIGFTTNGVSEYNYDQSFQMLDDDRREEPSQLNYFDYDDINYWTPRILESAVIDWCQAVRKEIQDIDLQCSH